MDGSLDKKAAKFTPKPKFFRKRNKRFDGKYFSKRMREIKRNLSR